MKCKNVIDPVNILRVISVLCVFFLHSFIFSSQLGFSFNEKNWFLKTPAWSAVWLFFLLSGYLIGKGFLSGRYKEDGKYTIICVFKFYIKRILKVAIPTWCFCFLAEVLLEPGVIAHNPMMFLKIFTFTYFNNPASNIIGVTWYVNTLMWLYLCAPFLAIFAEKILYKIHSTKTRHISTFVAIGIIVCIGFLFRIYLYRCGVDWSSKIYVPFYCNLDIYICGILLNFLNDIEISKEKERILKGCSCLLLFATIVVNTRIYYLSDFDYKYMWIYQYVFPSIYILIGGGYLFCFGRQQTVSLKPTIENVKKNPLRLIDSFASVSFEFYLLHSMVLNCIYIYITGATPLVIHIKLLSAAFLITLLLAVIMHRAFSNIKTANST